jgi:hypothetical protein
LKEVKTMQVNGLTPIAKVANAGISGAATTLLIYVAKLRGHDIPPEVAAAIVVLAMSAVGYLTKLKRHEVRM